MRSRFWAVVVGMAIAALGALAACSGPSGHTTPDGASAKAAASASAVAPAGASAMAAAGPDPPPITASLYQTRMDVGASQVEVRLHNGGHQNVTVSGVRLESSAFDAPMPYPRQDSLIRAGLTVDLPVALSAPVCPAAAAAHTVHLTYALPDGATGELQVAARDEGGRIAALLESECFAEEVSAVASLTITEPVAVSSDGRIADIAIEVRPTGRPGSLTIEQIGGTTLLQPVDQESGAKLSEGYPVGLTVAGPDAMTFRVAPNRCDPHAVAEDKQGTLFPVHVVLNGQPGLVRVAAPAEITAQLYSFVRTACSADAA